MTNETLIRQAVKNNKGEVLELDLNGDTVKRLIVRQLVAVDLDEIKNNDALFDTIDYLKREGSKVGGPALVKIMEDLVKPVYGEMRAEYLGTLYDKLPADISDDLSDSIQEKIEFVWDWTDYVNAALRILGA